MPKLFRKEIAMRVSESCGLKYAAHKTGVARTTIQSAVERGEIPSEKDMGGVPHVRLADVEAWNAKAGERRRGPKPKKA